MTSSAAPASSDRPANQLHLSASHDSGGAVILTATGEVDMETAPQLGEHALRFLSHQPPVLVLSLAEVEFLDSQGLATLVAIRRRADELGVIFRLAAPTGRGPTRVLRLTGLDKALALYDSVDAALQPSSPS